MRKITLCGVLGGAFLSSWALAAPIGAQDNDLDDASVRARIDDSVLVTGVLVEQERDELPVTADVLTRREIEARQATTVAELVSTLPGMMMVQQGTAGQNTSLFTRGTESDHTLVLWNGIELNSPYFGGFNWAFLPTEGTERVEVVRGPFSAVYGSDAIGGVVNVLSGDANGFTASVEGGEDSYLRGAVTAGGELGNLRFDFAGSTRQGDSEFQNGFFDSEDFLARAEWRGAQGARVGLLTRFNDSETGIPFSGGQPSLERTIAWEEFQVAAPFAFKAAGWAVAGQASLVETTSAFRDPADPFGFTSSDTDAESTRVRVQASRQLGKGLGLGLGGDFERLEVSDQSVFGRNLQSATQETTGAFGQVFWQGRRMSADASLRVDDNDVYGSATSPRVGASWRMGDRWRVRGSYGEAFRAPSLGELFFPFSGNSELEPEESESYELAIERSAERFNFSVTGFENRLVNLIDFDFVTFTNINVGRAKTKGYEVAANWTAPAYTLSANVTLLEAEDSVASRPLLRRAEETANVSLTLRPGVWRFNAVAQYVGERPDIDPVTFSRANNDSYVTADIAVSYAGFGARSSQAGRGAARLIPYARLENAFDERYQPVLGFPAQGRLWIVGLRFGY